MTKKREITPEDGHQHYWVRQFERSGGKKFPINLWICRICDDETLINPFQEEETP